MARGSGSVAAPPRPVVDQETARLEREEWEREYGSRARDWVRPWLVVSVRYGILRWEPWRIWPEVYDEPS